MTKFSKFTASAIVAAVAMSGVARADDPPQFNYSLTITALSDYLFRGISLTNNSPEFNPYLEFTYGIGYVGFWFSNVGDKSQLDFASLGPVEIDYYAGIRPTFGKINTDMGVLFYTFGSRIPGGDLSDVSYVEFKAGGTYSPAEGWTVGVNGYFTPDQGANYPQTETVEGSLSYAVPHKLWIFDPTISGGVGYSNFQENGTYTVAGGVTPFLGEKDYVYWNAGVKLTVEKWFMDFRYWDTSIRNDAVGALTGARAQDFADSRFLFSVGVTLP